ncbi:MAG: HAMP domain-containing protein [Kangiellaceae bacterium]|nr:HAMP domain-containing protein [Kangiellaceae bacterium]
MNIQKKLFLILFSFSLVLVVFLPMLMHWSIGRGMVEYVNTKQLEKLSSLVETLAEEYAKENNWNFMLGRHTDLRDLIVEQIEENKFLFERDELESQLGGTQGRPPGPSHRMHMDHPRDEHIGPPPFIRRVIEARYALLNSEEKVIAGNKLKKRRYSKKEIIVNDKVIGYLAISKLDRLNRGFELDFIKQQRKYLWVIALVCLGLVIIVTLPLAHHVVKPIRVVAKGIHQLTQGDFEQTIEITRRDEFGQLGRDYNELALTLSENETARKRWLADISHELRTPVAILRGELESMIDGVRSMNKANVVSANDEVKHLQCIIGDLNQLSCADIGGMRYRKETLELRELLDKELDKYRSYLSDAVINLTIDTDDSDIEIYGDRTRICQLFDNIINNCLKYSNATELNISLRLEQIDTQLKARLRLEDNGIGVKEIHLENLFEHLYRVEDSRNRKTGGAGLGLSICKQIVNAHQGSIFAERASLGGLAIVIDFPTG